MNLGKKTKEKDNNKKKKGSKVPRLKNPTTNP
jgi:hypothetical protein